MFKKVSDFFHTGSFHESPLMMLLLLLIAAVQGSSQLMRLFFPEGVTSEPSLLNVWLSLGDEISKNWVAVSILLIALVLGYILLKSMSNTSVTRNTVLKIFALLAINLLLCLRLYSNQSLSEKIQYLMTYLPTTIIVAIIAVFVIAVIMVMQKASKLSDEIENQYWDANRSHSSPEDEDSPNAKSNESDSKKKAKDVELLFRLKHPVFYSYRGFFKYLDDRREIKLKYKEKVLNQKAEKKAKKIQKKIDEIQNGTSKKNDSNKYGKLSLLLSAGTLFIIAIYLYFNKGDESLFELLEKVLINLMGISKFLGTAEGTLMGLLVSIGVVFLFVVLFLSTFLLLYASFRVFIYILVTPSEDTDEITKLGRAIKVFVFETLESMLKPLLFLPTFLECVEDMLLDTDLEEKIAEMYPNRGSPNGGSLNGASLNGTSLNGTSPNGASPSGTSSDGANPDE